MEISPSIRSRFYEKLSKAGCFLYAHPLSGARLKDISRTYVAEERYNKFAITVGDIILGFYKIEDTVPLLQQELGLDPKTAALLGAEVLEFLAPLSDPNWQPPVEADENEVAGESETVQEALVSRIPVKAPAPVTETSSAVIQAPTEAVVSTIAAQAPIQTFASDMAAVRNGTPAHTTVPAYEPTPTYSATPEPVYQSTQPAARPNLGNIPSYATPSAPAMPPPTPPAPDRPRWSTEI